MQAVHSVLNSVLNSDRPYSSSTAAPRTPLPLQSTQSEMAEESLVNRVRNAALIDPSLCLDMSCDRPVPSRFE